MTSGSWYNCDNVDDHDALLRRCHASSPMTMAEKQAARAQQAAQTGNRAQGYTTMPIHWQDSIEERKEVMMRKSVCTGTRLTVAHILQELGPGMSQEELLSGYPQLTPEPLCAAMLFSAARVSRDQSMDV